MEIKKQLINIAKQTGAINSKFGGKISKTSKSLKWKGILKPSPLGKEYLTELRYSIGQAPKVFVLEPKLERKNGKLPHTYQDGSLCLYLPVAREWHPGLLLASTIIPWACEWLYHYEIWLLTGAWNGGGIDHSK